MFASLGSPKEMADANVSKAPTRQHPASQHPADLLALACLLRVESAHNVNLDTSMRVYLYLYIYIYAYDIYI